MKSLFNVRKSSTFLLFICAALFMTASPAKAQVIVENTQLDFGKFVLVDNAAGRQIQLLAGGGYTADPEYIFFTTPQLGNFTVSGYGPGVPLTVTVGVTDLDPVGGGSTNFTTSSTFTDPAVIVTDGTGSVTFDVGATLTSDGTASVHTDDDYDGTYTITVTP